MALNSYLIVKGKKQGSIKGSVIQKGREGWIEVIAFEHDLVSPRDPASGLPTGKRIHKPLVITKELDKSTPSLYNALINNETLSSVELKCFAPNRIGTAGGAGVESNHFNIMLTNAQVVSISSRMLNNKNPELVRYEKFEEIAFTYQKISWNWTDGGLTAQDQWMGEEI